MADLDPQLALTIHLLAVRLAIGGGQRCRLIKLASATGAILRTDAVDGLCIGRPARGRIFELLAKALTPATDWRYVNTTPVQMIQPQQAGVLQFWTESGSIYLWEPLPTTDAPCRQA